MKYKEKRVYKHIPEGWKIDENASNHPLGTKWIHNGKSRFTKGGAAQRQTALLVTDEKTLIKRMATNRRRGKTDGFKTDKTTEAKVQAEIRRQNRVSAKTAATRKPVRKAATIRKSVRKTTAACKPAKKR